MFTICDHAYATFWHLPQIVIADHGGVEPLAQTGKTTNRYSQTTPQTRTRCRPPPTDQHVGAIVSRRPRPATGPS